MPLHSQIEQIINETGYLIQFLFVQQFSGTATLVTALVAYILYRKQVRGEKNKALMLVRHELKAACDSVRNLKRAFIEMSASPSDKLFLFIIQDLRSTRHWEELSSMVAPIIGIENTGMIDSFYSNIVTVERFCKGAVEGFFQMQNQPYIERESLIQGELLAAAKMVVTNPNSSLNEMGKAQAIGNALTDINAKYNHNIQMPGSLINLLDVAVKKLDHSDVAETLSKLDKELEASQASIFGF